jgi:hypothetical protein
VPRQTIQIRSFTLCDAKPGSDVDDIRARPESDWLLATVPGGVHEALLAAGRIADRTSTAMRTPCAGSSSATGGYALWFPPRRQHSAAVASWCVADWIRSPIFGSTASRSATARTCSGPPSSTSQVAWSQQRSCSSASDRRLLG